MQMRNQEGGGPFCDTVVLAKLGINVSPIGRRVRVSATEKAASMTAPVTRDHQTPTHATISRRIARNIKRFPQIAAILSLTGICIIFGSLSRYFLTITTWGEILATGAELGIIAVPMALLMISGNIDLSVGSIYALSGMIFLSLLNAGTHPILALTGALASSAVVGLVNGAIVVSMRIHSFIVTLGMMMFIRGILLVWTGGFAVEYRGGSTGVLTLLDLLAGPIGGSPVRMSAVWLILTTVGFSFVLGKTRHGNWSLAVGGDHESARDEGVLVNRVQVINFILVGLFSGLSGLVLVGRMTSAFPTLGVMYELEAIASAVMGGCLLMGGAGSVFGAFIGALLMSTMRIGLVLAGAPAYWYQAFIGLLVILAVVIRDRIERLS